MIGAERKCTFAGCRQGIQRDDRRRSDQSGDLHRVYAEPADSPQANGLPTRRPARSVAGVRRGDRIGQYRRLLKRQVVPEGGQRHIRYDDEFAQAPS